MKTIAQERPTAAQLVASMRKDLSLTLFHLLPLMEDFSEELSWLATKAKVTPEQAEKYKSDLIYAGLWVRDPQGRLRNRQDWTNASDAGKDLKASEFLTMSAQIFSHIAPDGPCFYEARTVVTSHDLKRQFLTRMHENVRDFLEASKTAKGEAVLTWSHVILDTLKTLERQEIEE